MESSKKESTYLDKLRKIYNILKRIRPEGVFALIVAVVVWLTVMLSKPTKDFVIGYLGASALVYLYSYGRLKELWKGIVKDEFQVKKSIWNFIINMILTERMFYILIGFLVFGGAAAVALAMLDLGFGIMLGGFLSYPVVVTAGYMIGLFKTMSLEPEGEAQPEQAKTSTFRTLQEESRQQPQRQTS